MLILLSETDSLQAQRPSSTRDLTTVYGSEMENDRVVVVGLWEKRQRFDHPGPWVEADADALPWVDCCWFEVAAVIRPDQNNII